MLDTPVQTSRGPLGVGRYHTMSPRPYGAPLGTPYMVFMDINQTSKTIQILLPPTYGGLKGYGGHSDVGGTLIRPPSPGTPTALLGRQVPRGLPMGGVEPIGLVIHWPLRAMWLTWVRPTYVGRILAASSQ